MINFKMLTVVIVLLWDISFIQDVCNQSEKSHSDYGQD